MDKIKILVISSTPWNNKNSFGITFGNFFAGLNNIEIANIYCSSGVPCSDFPIRAFQITFSMLLHNLKDSNSPCGKEITKQNSGVTRTNIQQKLFNIARIFRWQILFWGREFIWWISRWRSKALLDFVEDFNPDLIFQPVYPLAYINRINNFIYAKLNVPMIAYISDDDYSFRQIRFSPLYWLNRLWLHGKIKKTIDLCDILYVISDIQKKECEKAFSPECKILTKSADFSSAPPTYKMPTNEFRIVFAGNIDSGRKNSLIAITQAVKNLVGQGWNVHWDIYTSTPLLAKTKQNLSGGVGVIHPPIDYIELRKIQQEANILVHVEGLDLKSRFAVHQSFSTKLVDFFEMAKCIFAVGTEDVASIHHLMLHDAAVVAQKPEEIEKKLEDLFSHPEKILEYGQKAYQCGMHYHDRKLMQGMLYKDICRLTGKMQ